MGLGHTEIARDQNLAFTEQARMASEFLDALKIDRIDLVGNDSGGGISQLLAVRAPERIRSLTLTNCEVHDNPPSPGLVPIQEAAKAGLLRLRLRGLLEDLPGLRTAFGTAFQHADRMPLETFKAYLEPPLATDEKAANLERFITSLDHHQMIAIEDRLKKFTAPTMILWGTGDVFFPLKLAHWLKKTIPGAREVIEVPGALLFFPEEYPELVSEKLRTLWASTTP
jgi:pimeloyl-ACP methyl ester carboxylesterase